MTVVGHLTSHDPSLSVAQGMNMLVAIGILFLDEETVFWMLVAIIEKLLAAHYFTPGLLGAQADQVGRYTQIHALPE